MTVRVLHYSDVENAYDDPERIGRLARVLRERAPSTLVCGTGDVTAPGFLSMETDGDHALPFFEAVAPDVGTFGNHEFDLGIDSLKDVVASSPQEWVTANLHDPGGDRPFGADVGVRESVVETVDGERIGLFGVTNPSTVRSHALAEEVAVEDPIEAARRVVADLREGGVDRVVALSHLGDLDDELVAAVDVDAVLGGHTHGERATVAGGTALTRPGARARRVAAIEFGAGSPSVALRDVTAVPVDGSVADRYRELFASVGLDETVATLSEPIPRRPVDTYPESRIGNAVADAYRWFADADVAVCNAKMLRAGPPLDGAVTLGDLRSTTPFENDIRSVELSGAELLTLFDNLGAPDPVDVELPEVFAHVSGACLRWRRDAEGIALAGATVGGDPVDPGDTYVVAAPTFAFFNDIFAPLSRDLAHDTHGDQHEALAGYVREVGLPDSTDGRMEAVEDALAGSARSL